MSLLVLGAPELPEVELKLLALKNVTISTTGLARSAGDVSVETAGRELSLKEGVDLGILLLLIQAALCVVGELLGLSIGIDC